MKKTGWAVAVSLVPILALAIFGWAGTIPQQAGTSAPATGAAKEYFNRKPFSADMVMSMNGNKEMTRQGKISAGDHAMRMEMEVQPGMQSTIIVRYDKKVVWMLIPGQQRYMEMPLTPRAGVFAQLRNTGAKVDMQDLGPEKVGEYDCEKYRFHSTSQGVATSGLAWVASSGEAKGFIVRTEDEKSGAMMEFRNIRPGEPPASLFEVPAGYQKMEMPAMPGMQHE